MTFKLKMHIKLQDKTPTMNKNYTKIFLLTKSLLKNSRTRHFITLLRCR